MWGVTLLSCYYVERTTQRPGWASNMRFEALSSEIYSRPQATNISSQSLKWKKTVNHPTSSTFEQWSVSNQLWPNSLSLKARLLLCTILLQDRWTSDVGTGKERWSLHLSQARAGWPGPPSPTSPSSRCSAPWWPSTPSMGYIFLQKQSDKSEAE